MKVLFLMGTTASGKTALAIEIAKIYGAEIINCDSIQCYKGLDIGSAKPSVKEQEGIPHHLFSHVDLGKSYTAGDYERDALNLLANLSAPLAIVVGGSGFYFNALENGMFAIEKVEPSIKLEVENLLNEKGLDHLYQMLVEKDPIYAKTIAANDSYRIARAIEIVLGGNLPSQLKLDFKKRKFPYPLLKVAIDLERESLRQRVRERARLMLENGLVAETKALIEKTQKDWAPLNSVGYKEVKEYLAGDLAEADLAEKISTKTMQLAKKQRTWFRRDKDILWLNDKKEVLTAVDRFMRGAN